MANWFVVPGGAGSANGTSWTNAWNMGSIAWGSVAAGDTVWISGGTYSGTLTISAPGTSGNPVKILRSTSSDAAATGSPGWNASTMDAPIILNAPGGGDGVNFTKSYVTIDGRTNPSFGVGAFVGWTINYGGSISSASGSGMAMSPGGVLISDITVRFIKILGPGTAFETGDTRGMNFSSGTGGQANTIVEYCDVGNGGDACMYMDAGGPGCTNCIIQHNWFHDAASQNPASFHTNTVFYGPGSFIIRYNSFFNTAIEGLFFNFGPPCNVQIYSNLFYQNTFSAEATSRALTFDQGSSNNAGVIYNNTFVDFSAFQSLEIPASTDTYAGLDVQNNLFWNCQNPGPYASGITHDFQFGGGGTTISGEANGITGGSQPFTNYSLKNNSPSSFHIIGTVGTKFPRQKGKNLGAPYNIDYAGNIRPASGAWDIGAYQFVTSGGTIFPAPNATSNSAAVISARVPVPIRAVSAPRSLSLAVASAKRIFRTLCTWQ